MTQYPESGVKLVADTKEYTSAMEEALSLADQFDALGDMTMSISAELDTTGVDVSDLPLDGETVNFTVEVDQTGDDVTDLPTTDETVTTTVEVDETDTAKESLSALNTLKNLKIIETVWNIAGTAVDVIKKFSDFSITPMLNLEDAVARVNAQTGNAIPDAERLISGIFYDDLGESIDQVANLVTQAHNLQLPIEQAATAALKFTHTFKDQDPTQVLNTIDAMLQSHIAPDARTAGDLLVTAFQNGENKGKDLLTAIQNNATAIEGMGLTGPEALSFIKTGMDNGITSAEGVLKALEKIKQNVTSAAGNATSDVTKTLNVLGIANPAETGEAWSAEFFTKVIEGIKNQPGLSDTEKEVLFTNLIGGKQGGKTFAAFMKMSPTDAASIFENVKGAADTAATEVDNSLRGAIDDFTLAAQKAAEDFLSSEQIDLPGKIAALKGGIQDALNVLGEGGSLGEALTIALKPIGFDDEFQGLESVLGNFVIAILQVVAAMQALHPANWEAKKGTDATIARMGANQLAFDLKIANPDDIAVDIATAVSRGVAPKTIADTISGTVDELISQGALKQAQMLVDTLSKPVDQNTVPTLASGAPMNVEPVIPPDGIAALQKQIDDASSAAAKGVILTAQNEVLNGITPVKAEYDAFQESARVVVQKTSDFNTQVKKVQDSTAAATKTTGAMGNAAAEVTSSTDSATMSFNGMVASLDAITGKVDAFNAAAGTASDKAATDSNNPDPGKQAAGGSDGITGTFLSGEKGPEVITTNRQLAVLNHMTTDAIMSALQGYVPGGSLGRGGGGNTYNLNNTNFVQSDAQADRLGYKTAEQLRGMG